MMSRHGDRQRPRMLGWYECVCACVRVCVDRRVYAARHRAGDLLQWAWLGVAESRNGSCT